jgi:probable blue pigment (indigoidine) exporter
MIFVTASWGVCFVAISWGLDYASPLWFATLRSGVAGAALLGLAALRGSPFPRGTRAWSLIALLALTNAALAFGTMFASVADLSTGIAAVLANAQPLLILLPAWWFYGERVRPVTAMALVAGFSGLLMVSASSGSGRGATLSLVAAVAITAGTLISRRLAGGDLVSVTAWHFLAGALMLAIAAAALEGVPNIAWTAGFVAVTLALGVLGTAIPFVLWFQETIRAPLVSVAAWTFLVPIFAVLVGTVLLGERLSNWSAAGLALVLASLWLALHPSGWGLRRRIRRGQAGHEDSRRTP